ncbi:hypothetical protein ACFOOP_07385 [Marinicaulis aureus]|uniref:Uncharacterized protein n=1 Tax=Hyphococcus aureus TaxID=2666033 RepID=A0ABW1KV07_9PROT
MTDSAAEIVTADDMADATKEWVTSEASKVGDRYFEIAKFLFGASAGAFAVIPFLSQLGGQLNFSTLVDFVPLALLAIATLLAILMALPMHFEVNHTVDVVAKHRSFIQRQRRLIFSWLLFWAAGIFLLFLKATTSLAETNVTVTQ